MQKKLLTFFFKNLKSIGLIILVVLTVTIAVYSNQKENLSKNQSNDFINNIYFKKTLNEIVNNLEPRYKKYNHKIKSGETFDKILSEYSIEKEEIIAVKESLSKKFNINKLNTNQKIEIILDKTNNKIKEFIFQISNTEKIYLSKSSDELKFNEKILSIKLDKKIKIYKYEKFNEILNSDVDIIVLAVSSKGIEWVSEQLSKIYKDKKIPKLLQIVV